MSYSEEQLIPARKNVAINQWRIFQNRIFSSWDSKKLTNTTSIISVNIYLCYLLSIFKCFFFSSFSKTFTLNAHQPGLHLILGEIFWNLNKQYFTSNRWMIDADHQVHLCKWTAQCYEMMLFWEWAYPIDYYHVICNRPIRPTRTLRNLSKFSVWFRRKCLVYSQFDLITPFKKIQESISTEQSALLVSN